MATTPKTKTIRISNDALLNAGLALMNQNGKPLSKVPGTGRSMIYALANGERVRVRTCNDHVLIVLADNPSPNAPLNIDGPEWLLVVMPEIERTPGNVLAYLVPTSTAADAARQTHQQWLATNPKTKTGNTTWNLSFRKNGHNLITLWSQYRLPGAVTTQQTTLTPSIQHGNITGTIKGEVEAARQSISKAAGVLPDAVKITIEFAGSLATP